MMSMGDVMFVGGVIDAEAGRRMKRAVVGPALLGVGG